MSSQAYITKQFYSELSTSAEPFCLSLIIGPAFFQYAITSRGYEQVVELCHVEITAVASSVYDSTQTISQLLNNYRLSQRKFSKVNISFLNHEFTLVPGAYAERMSNKELLGFSAGLVDVKRTLQHTIKNINFCYTVDPELLAFIERTFPGASLRHCGAVALSLFFSQHSLLHKDLYLSVSDGMIELMAKQNNELLFYNNYNYNTNEDILYYLLFAMEQFRLDPLLVKLVVSGQRELSDELVLTIKKYVKQVSFAVQHPGIDLRGDLSKLPGHFYFTLLNQHLCEL